jgi:predicted nuclease of predicted toxin-antitoxin system
MKIRFQADADFSETIIQALQRREPAIDFQTADKGRIRGLPDPEVLAAAARENRILVSHDHHTMPVHFANFIATQQSPGVFLLAQNVPIRIAVEALLMIWEASEAEEWINTLQYLPL